MRKNDYSLQTERKRLLPGRVVKNYRELWLVVDQRKAWEKERCINEGKKKGDFIKSKKSAQQTANLTRERGPEINKLNKEGRGSPPRSRVSPISSTRESRKTQF